MSNIYMETLLFATTLHRMKLSLGCNRFGCGLAENATSNSTAACDKLTWPGGEGDKGKCTAQRL